MSDRSLLFMKATVYTPEGFENNGIVKVNHGRIESIWKEPHPHVSLEADEMVDGSGMFLIPGFVDIHVHGGGGFDFNSGDAEQVQRASLFHARSGTTSLLATTLTASPDELEKAVQTIASVIERGSEGADIVGIHLEGPFINAIRAGAQNPSYIRSFTWAEMDRYLELSKGHLRLITLAPEIPGTMEAIPTLVKKGMTVSIGHSDATFKEVEKAVNLGARHITHLFNGMSPLHHREPGVAGAALMMDELSVELIADGHHVAKELVEFVFRTKTLNNVVLITDAVPLTGLPAGENYKLGGLACYLRDGQIRLIESDALAGSSLTMDTVLRNVLAFTKHRLEEILPALTINPARQIGLAHRKGSIEVGKDADLVLLDDHFQVQATYVKGVQVYARSN